MNKAMQKRVVMTAQSQKIVDDLHSRIVKLEALNASLSEALAEAEKKGAEAYEEAARIAESFINPSAFTREQQAASDTAGNIADMILFNAPPRDLSQGGQHGSA